jgi:predicted nucleic acid-binding protein
VTVFLDTVGLVAVWDKSDQWHKIAHACFSGLLTARSELITTTAVLLECGNAAARRPYRSAVNRLRQQLEQGNRLITPLAEDWQNAWFAYDKSEADAAGIVDHISFVVMRRLGITTAFTNDKHYRAAGLETMF